MEPTSKASFSQAPAHLAQGLGELAEKEDNADEDEDCSMEAEIGEEGQMAESTQGSAQFAKPQAAAAPSSQRGPRDTARKNAAAKVPPVPSLRLQDAIPGAASPRDEANQAAANLNRGTAARTPLSAASFST